MSDSMELTLRITLDRSGLERHLGRRVDDYMAFFVLGLVHAQVTGTFGEEHCLVDMESATGLDPAFVRSMNSFARRHKRALDTLQSRGEVMVTDRDILEVFQTLHDVIVTPVGAKWRVVKLDAGGGEPPGERSAALKN